MLLKKMALTLSVFAFLVSSAVAQDDILNTSKQTGMSPGVASKETGVRTASSSLGSMANVAGAWSLVLNDVDAARSLKLTLYQNNEAVFGSGDITTLGSTTPVSAGGTLKGNSLTLYVIPSGELSLYKVDMIVAPGSLNGSYVFSTQTVTQPSEAVSGRMTEASQTAPVYKNIIVTTQVGAGQTNAEKPEGPKGTAV